MEADKGSGGGIARLFADIGAWDGAENMYRMEVRRMGWTYACGERVLERETGGVAHEHALALVHKLRAQHVHICRLHITIQQ